MSSVTLKGLSRYPAAPCLMPSIADFKTAVSGNDDDFDVGMVLFDFLQEIEALPIGEFLIECNEVDALMIQHIDRGSG